MKLSGILTVLACTAITLAAVVTGAGMLIDMALLQAHPRMPSAELSDEEHRIAVAFTSSAVYVNNYDGDSIGTGVVIAGKGIVLTDWHVVDNAGTRYGVCVHRLAWRETPVGNSHRYEAQAPCIPVNVERYRDDLDLAVLRPANPADKLAGGLQIAEETPGVGSRLFKFGITTDVTSGWLVVPWDSLRDSPANFAGFTAWMRAYEGDSGGPIMTAEGKLVGLVHRTSQSDRSCVGSSVEDIKQILE